MVIPSIVLISLALVFYSIGVWGEKIQGILKTWHLVFFYLGLGCDFLGTSLMFKVAETTGKGDFLHILTGVVAIVLMLFHALWATYILIKGKEEAKIKFHRFSLFVWIIWLIPYFSGMFMNM